VLAALRRLDIKTETFDPATRPLTDITNTDMIRVFNILHGGAGENGEIRGALKTLGLACTGSGLLGSALAMDKHRTKLLWRGGGIPTPQWELATDATDAARVQEALGLPLFVKPSCGGSSTHAAVVRKSDELPAAIVAAASEGAPALVEQFVDGDEYTASIIDDTVLPLIGRSIEKWGYLPESHNDFIISIIAEETGLLGLLIVCALIALLVMKAINIARRAEERGEIFGALYAFGFAVLVTTQSAINICGNLALLPSKGFTLPLVSYGGSSLLSMGLLVGVLLRIDFENRREQRGGGT
jgi:hypothetical protein